MATERIDVLAVIDREIDGIAGESWFDDEREADIREREDQLRKARAAIAEIIEAAKDAKVFYWQVAQSDGLTTQQHSMSVRLTAALARFGETP